MAFGSDPGVTLGLLFVLICSTPFSYLLNILVFVGLRRSWVEYAVASKEKQEKSAKNVTKTIVYIIISCLLLPISLRIIHEWYKNGFTSQIPEFHTGYTRIVLAIIPPFYTFELVTTAVPSKSMWWHHGGTVIISPFVVSGYFFNSSSDSQADALYLLYTAVLALQVSFLSFIFFAGHAIVRIWKPSIRKYKWLYGLVIFDLFVTVGLQVVIWLRLAAGVSKVSSWIPIALTVVMSFVTFAENCYFDWRTLSMARYVQRQVWTQGEEKATLEV